MSSMQEDISLAPARRSGRGPFWALLIITGLPFLLALYLFYQPELLARLGTINHGQLIQPPRALPALQLQTAAGEAVEADPLKGKWVLLMVGDRDCSEACQKNLYYLRQIRRAMGKDRYRVARVMVPPSDASAGLLAARLKPFEGTLLVAPGQRGALLSLLEVEGKGLANRVYIADPKGMLILAYPPSPPWRDVLKDLEHLLKVVQQ